MTLAQPYYFQAGEDPTPAKLNRRFDMLRVFISVKPAAAADGVTDDVAGIQGVIDQVGAAGGGTVLLPPGRYYTSGPLNLNVAGVRLLGDNATIVSKTTGEGAKIVVGASSVIIEGIAFDGAHTGTTGTPAFSYGLIDIVNSGATARSGVVVKNCTINNSECLGVRVQGNIDGVEFTDNRYTGNFVHFFLQSDGASYAPRNVCSFNNRYFTTWYTGGFSGAVKCKGDGAHSLITSGLRFTREHVVSSAEMGIELFDTVHDSSVVDCIIDGTKWGVSVDNGQNITISLNKIYRNAYTGIEIANLTNRCLVCDNTMDEYASGTTRGTGHGIISSGPACFENKYLNNTVRGCSSSGVELQGTDKDFLQGNTIVDCGTLWYHKAANRVAFVRNFLFGPCDQHVFVDVNDASTTDVDVTDNWFLGAAGGDNIVVYNNGHATTLTNLRIARNNVVSATHGSLSINRLMPDSQLPNLQVEDNDFQRGAATYAQFDADATSYHLVPPFAKSMHRGGITGATKRLISLPSNASPSWVQVMSLTFGSSFFLRLHVYAHDVTSALNNELSVAIAAAPYDQGSAIEQLPSGNYVPGVVDEVIYNNPTGTPVHEVWLKIKPLTAAVTVQCHFSDYPEGVIVSPVPVGAAPTLAANSYRLTVGDLGVMLARQTPAITVRNFIACCDRAAVASPQARLYVRDVAPTGFPGNTRIARYDVAAGTEAVGITDTGQLIVNNGMAVGGGDGIASILSSRFNVNFGTVLAGSVVSVGVSLPGARSANNPLIMAAFVAGLPAGVVPGGHYVSADDVAQVVLQNVTAGDIAVNTRDTRLIGLQY